MADVTAVVQQTINEHLAIVKDFADQAKSYADEANTASQSGITLPPLPTIRDVTVTLPPFNPNVDLSTEWTKNFDKAFTDFGDDFTNQWTAFLNAFFPELDSCLRQSVDDWLCNTIQNGGTGIPAPIEQQIYDRGRAREQELGNKFMQEATDQWAARGFSLPPGTLINRMEEASLELSRKQATYNRDVVIKNIEIEIENIRFAVGQAANLRVAAIQAAIAYVRAWFLVPETAINKASALTDQFYKLWQTTNAYYSALVAVGQLQLDVDKSRAGIAMQDNANFVALVMDQLKARAGTAGAIAAHFGQVAQAALGSNNTLANLGSNTISKK